MYPLNTDTGLRAELWLVMPSQLFDIAIEGGKLRLRSNGEYVLTVPAEAREEIVEAWGKITAAFARAGYHKVRLEKLHT